MYLWFPIIATRGTISKSAKMFLMIVKNRGTSRFVSTFLKSKLAMFGYLYLPSVTEPALFLSRILMYMYLPKLRVSKFYRICLKIREQEVPLTIEHPYIHMNN
uniref:Uncharacterized protein n=1 Tax=Cacopsylla melanoneura TaxID=428564 RepID=A0A8D9BS82_9HEMI